MIDIRTTWVVQTGTGDWSVAGGALASGNDLRHRRVDQSVYGPSGQ